MKRLKHPKESNLRKGQRGLKRLKGWNATTPENGTEAYSAQHRFVSPSTPRRIADTQELGLGSLQLFSYRFTLKLVIPLLIEIMRSLLLLTVCLLPITSSAEDKLSLNTGLEYTSGNYGATTDTDIWSLPIGLKYQTGPLTFRLGTSWLRITGPGGVTPEGEPIGSPGARSTEHGMGDITTSLTWTLLDTEKSPFGLDVGGKVKFGTADEKKYLGTGKNDYALHTEIFKHINAWYPFFKLGYNWKGDPTGINYNNVWFGSTGTNYRFSKTYSAGAYYDWREKLTPTGNRISEATVYFNTRLNESNKLNIYLIKGFSDASPDWGAGLSLSHRF